MIVKQESGTAGTHGDHSTKRQRTDRNQFENLVLVHPPLPVSFPSTAPLPPNDRFNYPPMPTHISTQGPPRTSQNSHQDTPFVPLSTVQASNSTPNAHRQTPLLTPAEAHHQRMAGFDELMSAHRSNTHFGPDHRPGPHTSQAQEQSRAPMAPMIARSSTSLRGTTKSIHSASPTVSVWSSPQIPRTSLPQSTRNGPSEVIDLTGDVEKARQDLLSSFKSKPRVTEPSGKAQELPARHRKP